jgi:hypothetical protein
MKLKSTKILQIITSVYAALYITGMVISFFRGEISYLNLIDNLSLLLLIIFIVGFALSWTKVKMAGIVFMVWNACVWIYDIYLTRDNKDSGMLCIMAVPILVIGAFLLLQWYKTSREPQPSNQQKWRFILRVLLINYLVLYAIVVFTELAGGKPLDYFSIPFILFPLLLLVFLVGFALSWKSEFLAGLIFLLWYAIMLYGSFTYSEFNNSGPWNFFGFPIFLQGLFYIINHFQYRHK